MRNLLFCLGMLIWGHAAFAGVFEVSASGNYRMSRIDSNNYQELVSYTGSISYYFWEMSALEMSYTQGTQIVVLQFPSDNKNIITTQFQMGGLDLVLTLADKRSFFQPFVKGGVAYIQKDVVREVLSTRDRLETPSSTVPSAGIGFKLKFTEAFALKAGVDAWTSGSDQKTMDYAGRAGISWMF